MINCKRKAPDKIVSTDGQTDGRTDRQPWRFQYTPFYFVVGDINIVGKGGNASNQHFLLFRKCFLP